MLSLLIVDDEAIILDGLTELFHTAGLPELEVYRANSAMSALKVLERSKIDIVLTDIRMPEMSGLELFDRIRQRWPRCKVIFLTGYNEFQYVQEALRKGGADYVLKMDGDEDIVRAVEKTIADIGKEADAERFLADAKRKVHMLQPVMQREYVGHLVMGEPFTAAGLANRFAELDIPLAPDRPAYMAIGTIDAWDEAVRPSDKPLLLFAVQNIARELLPEDMACLSMSWDASTIVWLVQGGEEAGPEGEGPAHLIDRRLQDALESTQQEARRYLKLRLSFVCSGLFPWTDIGGVYDRLLELGRRGAGFGQEIAYLNTSAAPESEGEERRADALRAQLKRFVFLESYLENGSEAEFHAALQALTDAAADGHIPLPLRLEAFNKVSGLFLSYINRQDMKDAIGDAAALDRLTRMDAHASWADAAGFYRELADRLFALRKRKMADRGIEIVSKVQAYVERNLAGDLSLGRLGQAVYLNPAYLSRLYKGITGVGLSDYVTDKRIRRAKELLRSTDMKIQDITAAVGLESPSYFARLFKRLTTMSPQEYRESRL